MYMDIPIDDQGNTYGNMVTRKYPQIEGKVNHVHHAGNSSGVVDGAAALLLASEGYMKKHGLKARARIVATANMGDCPTLMLNAPVAAAKKVLDKAGLKTTDIDVYEINEAFSVVAEKFIRDLKLDREKVNINGGAMALGHPIGATGSILIGTCLDELERSGGRYGLATLCVEKGILTQEELERRAQGAFPLALPSAPGRANVPTRETLKVGDKVTVKTDYVHGHVRMPGYIRGKSGVVVGVSPRADDIEQLLLRTLVLRYRLLALVSAWQGYVRDRCSVPVAVQVHDLAEAVVGVEGPINEGPHRVAPVVDPVDDGGQLPAVVVGERAREIVVRTDTVAVQAQVPEHRRAQDPMRVQRLCGRLDGRVLVLAGKTAGHVPPTRRQHLGSQCHVQAIERIQRSIRPHRRSPRGGGASGPS
jgi:hypothetical protein